MVLGGKLLRGESASSSFFLASPRDQALLQPSARARSLEADLTRDLTTLLPAHGERASLQAVSPPALDLVLTAEPRGLSATWQERGKRP